MFAKAMIVGDVHGDRGFLEDVVKLAKKNGCEGILQLGDFGYWPSYPEMLESYDLPVMFLDGNHEFYGNDENPGLAQYTEDVNEVGDRVFYVRRGSCLRIGNFDVLFMGGAYSIDKSTRTEGFDWFKEEQITDEQLNRVLDLRESIDIVLSHDAPWSFNFGNSISFEPRAVMNREKLDKILDRHCPDRWYFGHYHRSDVKFNYRTGTLLRAMEANCNRQRGEIDVAVIDFSNGEELLLKM